MLAEDQLIYIVSNYLQPHTQPHDSVAITDDIGRPIFPGLPSLPPKDRQRLSPLNRYVTPLNDYVDRSTYRYSRVS